MTVGATVPDFTMNDFNGDPVTFSEVQKEKTLLIFWSSWCSHCIEMLPQIKRWQLQNKEVEIVAVSLDTSENEWKNKVTELGIESWYNLFELKGWDGKSAEEYNIYATPTLILIDKNRKIISLPGNINDLR